MTPEQRERLAWLEAHADEPTGFDLALRRAEEWLALDRMAREEREAQRR